MLNAANTALDEKLTQAGIATRAASPAYLEDLRGRATGLGQTVALPTTTEEVATVVSLCAETKTGVIPFGGGTGLVLGQLAPRGPCPLILSLERMKQIRALYQSENTIVAEAGVTLSELHKAAEEASRRFPLNYASKDSAQIGSALSVNSGGLNVLRYGTARDLCLGIEAVLPNGDVHHGLKRLRKDNTGYDLRNLLIGAEGTLGIITAAALKLFPRPACRATAFIATDTPASALEMLSIFQDQAAEAISAFELIGGQAFAFLSETYPDLRQPFATAPPWAVLVELETGPHMDPETLLAEIYETAEARGLATDARLAQSGQQRDAFWTLRETIPAANRAIGAIASHDIALPLAEISGFLDEASQALGALFPMQINTFGHLGDGNLHYNLFPPKGKDKAEYKEKAYDLTRLVHDLTVARGGTFSAEHGVGRAKTDDLARYGDPAKLAAMRAIKDALDPMGIMNPGAVLPPR
ncbi:MAG: FAD-binding oxidoreductase [Pseudomonadota bacterium]